MAELPEDCKRLREWVKSGRSLSPECESHRVICDQCSFWLTAAEGVRSGRLERLTTLSKVTCFAYLASRYARRGVSPYKLPEEQAGEHRDECVECQMEYDLLLEILASREERLTFNRVAREFLLREQSEPVCQRVMGTLDRDDPDDDARWDEAGAHVVHCIGCSLYSALKDRSLNEAEVEKMERLKALNNVHRMRCPSLVDLARTEIPPGEVRGHVLICELCQDERRRLLMGEVVERPLPPSSDLDS